MSQRTLYASLIGINAYEKANKLNGCINDILNIDSILRGIEVKQNSFEYQPLYLLSPHDAEESVVDNYLKVNAADTTCLPATYKNLVTAAFDHLAKAKDNDLCLFYFSGHGSYTPAPEEFWHSKGLRQNETLLAADSRNGARSLIDKELAYLLYKTLEGKPNVHCLVITDCCHSGNNTRGLAEEEDITYREASPDQDFTNIEDYLGFRENFFTITNKRATFPFARYVHLAACRDQEKAADHPSGGIFSRALAELLNTGGTAQTYRSLIQSLASTIAIKNGQQHPVHFATEFSDLDRQFLGGAAGSYKPSYEVRYMGEALGWQMMAGNLQGITASGPLGDTVVMVEGENISAKVAEVKSKQSSLQNNDLDKLDKAKPYRAHLVKLGIGRAVVVPDRFLAKHETQWKILKDAFDETGALYFDLQSQGTNPAYCIGLVGSDDDLQFALTVVGSSLPMFKARKDPKVFLQDVDVVCKWRYVKTLNAPSPAFTADDFIFEVTTIEGQRLDRTTLNNASGVTKPSTPGETIDLSYRNDNQPAFRFAVRIAPKATFNMCYVQALYCGHMFGINTGFIEPSANALNKEGVLCLTYPLSQFRFNAIPVGLGKNYRQYAVNEVTDLLKIIISQSPNVDVNIYRQEPLERAEQLQVRTDSKSTTRGEGFESDEEVLPKDDWAAFDFNLRVLSDRKEQKLQAGITNNFGVFEVEVPKGFEALATVISTADLSRSRSMNNADAAADIITEPGLWGDLITETNPFRDVSGAQQDSGVTALEISVEEGKRFPELKEGEEVIIKPSAGFVPSRDVDALESTTIPYAYDEASGCYFPVGYSDYQDNIHITFLPRPTPGSLASTAITTRSLLGSVKLYFKKIFRKPVTVLTLHYFDSKWNETTVPSIIQNKLKEAGKDQVLPLVIHGIIGDTKSMIKGLQEYPDLEKKLPMLLSFDYENLGTKISETAGELRKALDEIGIEKEGMPKLTIIAHSMGGLLSRWMLEIDTYTSPFKKLIMVGTPNGGSEWSDTVVAAKNGAAFLISHALNITGPLKYVITGLSFFLKKLDDPLSTLKDMDNGGDIVMKLGTSKKPAVIPYYLVGADTKLLRDYDGSDSFFLKAKAWFRDGLLMPGLRTKLFKGQLNDMAVTLGSMKKVKGFDQDANVTILPGDHISYFTESQTRKKILEACNEVSSK